MVFQTVAVSRPYEQIVDQIAEEIRAGRLVRGERLPTERELSAAFGVSRGVVREAVKVLSAMGLVEPRQGSGLFVQNDPMPLVTRALTLSVAPEEKSVGRLFEFRRALETFAAENAAERRTAEAVQDIGAAAARTIEAGANGDVDAFGAADSAFHLAIYEAAGNPYLTITAGAIRDMQRDVADLFRTFPGSIKTAAAQHEKIAEAIAVQNRVLAAVLMKDHISYTAETVLGILRDRYARAPFAATVVVRELQ